MIELYVNGKLATLPTNASIPIKIHNPAFNKMGTYSEPFPLVIEGNRATMQYPEDEDNLKEITQTYELKIGGEVFMQGDLGVNDTVGTYKSYLKSGKSSIARILKESYLDGTINGQSWGDNPNGLADINASVNGHYPANNFVVAPVKLDDYTINAFIDGALTEPNIGEGKITPMVYLRYVIDRINQACQLLCPRNDFSLLDDFNRLCIFAPRKGSDSNKALTAYNEWMPHITAADLLNDIEQRFNIIPFFSPFGREVDYVHFDTIFTGHIIDWTDKFIRDEKVPPFQAGLTLLKNEAEDEEVLSPREIEEAFVLTEVATYDDLTITDEGYKVLDVNRYFKPASKEFDNALTRPLYFDTFEWFGSTPYRRLIETVDTGTNTLTNSNTVANTDNLIITMTFPDNKGEIFDNVLVGQFEGKVNVGDCTLIARVERVEGINGIPSVLEVLGEKQINLTNNNYNLFDTRIDLFKSVKWEALFDKDNNYLMGDKLAVSFYCRTSVAGRSISLKLGAVDAPIPQTGYTTIYADLGRATHTELGVLGTYEKGNINANKVREVEPKSKVLYNNEGHSGGYLFQMPQSDIDPKLEQKDYAYTIYRGLINDERNGGKTAPYCNFDVVDNAMKEYQSRVTNGATPDLSLRYHGEKGLANVLHKKRLSWFQYSHRAVRKVFDLSKNDLQNMKMYDRIRVDNKLYIVNIITLKAQSNDELSESSIDMFTL